MACLRKLWALRLVILVVVGIIGEGVDGAVSLKSMRKIMKINHEGPYLGLVVPNAFEMSPFLQSPSFIAHPKHPFIDIGGRRFRIGEVENVKIIMVMSGLGMVKGVLHFGIAGNANPNLQIGDVVIPQFWAHTGLWSWQRYGDGPGDELALESSGDYTRKIGYLDISNYDTDTKNKTESLLNNVWYQPEEVFPVNGVSEVRQHAFWLPVNDHYYSVAKNLESMTLAGCINSTCLQRKPMVVRVERGGSANIFVDNAAYREFLNTKFNITPIDMETAAVALVCHQQRTPFIVIRALSDLAGGGSDQSNEAGVFAPLAAQNAVDAVLRFIALLY